MPSTGLNQRQHPATRANNQGASAPHTLVETSSTLTDKRSNDRIRMGSVVSQTSNRSSASISSEHPARMCFCLFFFLFQFEIKIIFSFTTSILDHHPADSQYNTSDNYQYKSDFTRRKTY